jgi:GAF domain-containing protein
VSRQADGARLADRVLDGLPVFVAYLDADLVFRLVNPAGAEVLSRDRSEIVGRPAIEVLGEGSGMYGLLLETARTREARSITFTVPITDTGEEPATLAASLVPDVTDDGSLAGIFASAVEVTSQVTGLRRSARFGESLSVILQAIARMTDPMQLLDVLAAETVKALDGDYSLVSIRSGSAWVVTHHHGSGGEDRVGIEYPLEERPVIYDAAATGEIQYVENAAEHPRTNKIIMSRFGVLSFVAVPLTLRGETLGVFEIAFTRSRREFDDSTRTYLANLAGAASLAYGRMREYQHEHRIADTLQAALLRLPTAVEGLRFSSHYAAASDEALVGGDFFDVFELEEDRAGITIGDVSGKGLSAAIITSRVRDCLRLCALDGLTPAECVTKTSALLYRITPGDVFATLIFGIVDTRTGELTYVTAAHPGGILQRRDGHIILLEGANSVVGGFPYLEFTERHVTLEEGDALILYTDGLTEARRDGEMYGLDRMIDYLGVRKRSSLEALVNDVFNHVRTYTHNRLKDDVAMLAITLDRIAERPAEAEAPPA